MRQFLLLGLGAIALTTVTACSEDDSKSGPTAACDDPAIAAVGGECPANDTITPTGNGGDGSTNGGGSGAPAGPTKTPPKDPDVAAVDAAPVPFALTFSNITSYGYTITWPAAVDDVTAAADLEYQLVMAASTTDLATLEAAEAITGEGVIVPWTANALSKVITGRGSQETKAYAVIVRDGAGHTALYPAQSVTTLETGAPIVGSGITISAITHTSFHVSWGAAADPNGQALQYKLVRGATTADVDSIYDAFVIGGAATTGWINGTSGDFTGLTATASYGVSVLVKNASGKYALYSPVTAQTAPMRIFITTNTYSAQFTASSADDRCMNDPGKPQGGGNYKALVFIDGTTAPRSACFSSNCNNQGAAEHKDWVLAPNTTYSRPDGTIIGTTNALALLPNPLVNRFGTASSTFRTWGGMSAAWTLDATTSCLNWNSTSGGDHGATILSNSYYLTSDSWAAGSFAGCDEAAGHLCVEQ